MKSKWLRRILVVLALVAVAAALRLTVFQPKPVPVTVYRAARGRVEDTVTNSKSGTVKSRHRASLSPEIGGRVDRLPAHKGERVHRGDVLMRLYDGDYRAQVIYQERSLEATRAAQREACRKAEQAELDLRRNLRLLGDGVVSQEIVDRYQSQHDVAVASCEAARARTRQAKASLELARVNLAKTVIRAPFDGVIADITTEVGEWITPSPPGVPIPPVIELMDTGDIYVSAPLDEVDVSKARVGLPVRITMDSFPGRDFPGRVTRVAPYVQDIEEQNRTFEVEVEFDDPAFAVTIPPGTSADVEVILEARDDVLRVPSYALVEGSKVLVVRDGKLVGVPVKTGLRNWEFTEITSGLEEGDPVVVSLDRLEVQEGARAYIQSETEK